MNYIFYHVIWKWCIILKTKVLPGTHASSRQADRDKKCERQSNKRMMCVSLLLHIQVRLSLKKISYPCKTRLSYYHGHITTDDEKKQNKTLSSEHVLVMLIMCTQISLQSIKCCGSSSYSFVGWYCIAITAPYCCSELVYLLQYKLINL